MSFSSSPVFPKRRSRGTCRGLSWGYREWRLHFDSRLMNYLLNLIKYNPSQSPNESFTLLFQLDFFFNLQKFKVPFMQIRTLLTGLKLSMCFLNVCHGVCCICIYMHCLCILYHALYIHMLYFTHGEHEKGKKWNLPRFLGFILHFCMRQESSFKNLNDN